jgi:hypothetical protein
MSSDGSNNQGQQPGQGAQPEGQKDQVSDGFVDWDDVDDDEGDDAEKEVDWADYDGAARMFMGEEEPNTTKTKIFTTDTGLTKDVLGSVGDNYMAKMDDEIKNIVLNIVDQGFLFDAKGNVIMRKNIKPIRMGDYVTYGYLQDPSKIYQVKDRIEQYLNSLSDSELHNVFHHMGGRSHRAVDWADTMAKDYLQYGSRFGDSVITLPRFRHLKDKYGKPMNIKVEDMHIKDYGIIGSLTPMLSPYQKDISRSFIRDRIYSSMNIKQELKTYKDDTDSSKDDTDVVEGVTFARDNVLDNIGSRITALMDEKGLSESNATIDIPEYRTTDENSPATTLQDLRNRLANYKNNNGEYRDINGKKLIHTITLPKALAKQVNDNFDTVNSIDDRPMDIRSMSVFRIPNTTTGKEQFAIVFGGQISLSKSRITQGQVVQGMQLDDVATTTRVTKTYSKIQDDVVGAYVFNALKDVKEFKEAIETTDYNEGSEFAEQTFFTLENLLSKK